jgi:hypothetical protein
MKSDGKYKRTKLTMLRVFQTKSESKFSLGGRIKRGKIAPKPITLPKMPWDKSDTKTSCADDK